LLGLLMIAMLIVLWPGAWSPSSSEQPPTQPSQSSATQVTPAPATAPSAAPAGPQSAPEASAAAAATLDIECNHNFRDAKLEIFAGGQRLLTEKLEGKSGFLGRIRGTLKATASVPSGEQAIKVRVVSERDNYREEKEITGEFQAGAARALLIEFGKGSGIGMGSRKLTLKFKEPVKEDTKSK
jgi:hypothetical protein